MKPNLLNPARAALIGLALFALTPIARADLEDKITQSFPVQPGGQLVVELDRGAIEITTADAKTVDIEITRKARGSASKAGQILKDHQVTATQTNQRVEVRAEFKDTSRKGWFGRSPDLQVSCHITVPRAFDVDLKTAGGHIAVAGLTGKVQAHTAGGHLEFEKIDGPISGHTSGGHVTVAGCTGRVDLKTAGGSLDLSEITGDVTARTSGGAIRARKLTGTSVVGTSGGSIEAVAIRGQIEASTSGGSITADLFEQPAGDCTFKTSGGSVTVRLAKNVEVDVDARTSAGRVSSDFPVGATVEGGQKKNELRGKINGGGPRITAHTSAGNVRLEVK